MKILLIDSYDSFTFNVYQQLKKLGVDVQIIKNDEMSASEIKSLDFDRIVLSPGPGNPKTAGNILEVIEEFHAKFPILGICLGHQAIAEFFGGKIVKTKSPMHGYVSKAKHSEKGLYRNLPQNIEVGLYHSLEVSRAHIPACLEVTAISDIDVIMGIKHKEFNVEGIQFHPESVLTEIGDQIITNWLNKCHPEFSTCHPEFIEGSLDCARDDNNKS